jgi:hypothetical protein
VRVAADVVHQVRFLPQQVVVRYAWRSDSTSRVLAALLPAEDQQRLRAYTERLAALTEREEPAWDVSLVRLLGPMFDLARQRTAAGGDAAAENRAALLVLTLFAQAIGLYKEVTDSRGGSGFSFSDVAANRAGTRFGQNLVGDAARVQALLAPGPRETDLVPLLADLPDFMPEADFVRRFGGVGAPAYEAQLAEAEQPATRARPGAGRHRFDRPFHIGTRRLSFSRISWAAWDRGSAARPSSRVVLLPVRSQRAEELGRTAAAFEALARHGLTPLPLGAMRSP